MRQMLPNISTKHNFTILDKLANKFGKEKDKKSWCRYYYSFFIDKCVCVTQVVLQKGFGRKFQELLELFV